MGLFDHKKADPKKDSGVVLHRSGIVPAMTDRRSDAIPKLWDEEVDDQETTGETNHVPLSRRVNAFPHLMIMTGLGAGQLIPIDSSLIIGRSRNADVRVGDEGVSRNHCRVTRIGGKVVIEDLDSRNGTLVNGTKVMRAELGAGDRIQLGPDLTIQLSMYDDAEQTLARRLFDASTRDPLTRAFNRQYFAQSLETELSYARRHGTSLSVMMLDIDGMRSVNESHGQSAGDEVPGRSSTSSGTSSAPRTCSAATRAPSSHSCFASRCAPRRGRPRRLRMRIEATRLTHTKRPLSVTASIGVAEIGEPGAQLTAEGLVAVAEKRLHRAKLLGKNRVAAE